MNPSTNFQQMSTRSALCLLGLLGLTLFASPVTAQVLGSGASNPALFDNVINVPPSPNIRGFGPAGGGNGLTYQLNIFDGGSIGRHVETQPGSEINISGGSVDRGFETHPGSEVNISGGSVGDNFSALNDSEVNISGGTIDDHFYAWNDSTVNISGGTIGDRFIAFSRSEVNISGGTVGDYFSVFSRGEVNISGGTVGDNFIAYGGSAVNLIGSDFVLDGVPLDSLTNAQAFMIVDRDVTLTGLLTDGSPFSFDLNTDLSLSLLDYFNPDATITVTLGSSVPTILSDVNRDGVVNFLDIAQFIEVLSSATFLEQADCNQDGVVDFLDISAFISILTGN